MIKQEISIDLNIFLSLSEEITPLTLQNITRATIGSKPKKFDNVEAQQNVGYSYYENVYCLYCYALSCSFHTDLACEQRFKFFISFSCILLVLTYVIIAIIIGSK